ncbi:type 1 glutamine amidotransferase [Streptomyces mangrovisoli]|uniref:Aminotransferase n=1 Tax=Streptomyces mangrovisoli TaxID=1428628 RepID=A0A1J4NS36_9ACTN|nr:type 1 glutamine amidotransferase [Streptomyces mangrovisoli]OIJ64404.1 aminotransferase [Streptomyces mangrovisoli]
MRALVLRHDHASLPGPVGERLVERGYDLDERTIVPAERYGDPVVDFGFPAVGKHDLVLALGAPWSVYDRDKVGRWIDGELALLRGAHRAGVPVLAICFGAQALATALGGSVERAPRPEIGWTPVDTAAPELVPAGPWFQWHFDRFTVPPGAVELARSAVGPQAFRTGRSLAVQFHPELAEPTLRMWLDLGGTAEAAAHGLDAADLMSETRQRREESRRRAHDLVDAFLDSVATAPEPEASLRGAS